MIRKAAERDLPAIVDIHMSALSNDLLPNLGRDFLKKEFYPTVLTSKHALTLVNVEDVIVNAFVTFADDSDALTTQIMRNKVMLAKYVFLGLIKNITLIGEIISHIKGCKTEIRSRVDIDLKKIPELYLMATAREHQAKGIGGQLISKGLEVLSQESQACLAKTSSNRAKGFYLEHHFEEIGYEYRGKRKLYILLYRHSFNNDSNKAVI